LKSLAKKSGGILATDPDREGEAIAGIDEGGINQKQCERWFS
jgi:DNA topoisomerase IA